MQTAHASASAGKNVAPAARRAIGFSGIFSSTLEALSDTGSREIDERVEERPEGHDKVPVDSEDGHGDETPRGVSGARNPD